MPNINEMQNIIRTSDDNWIEKSAENFTKNQAFTFIDDAQLGITGKDLKSGITLLKAAKKKGEFRLKHLVGVLAGLGITGAGVWIVAAAIADPEPTTKLGLLIGGGILLALTGSLGALKALGHHFHVSVKSPTGHIFEIKANK